MYRIIIADDEAVECRALEMMIENDFPQLEVVPSVYNGIDFIAGVQKYHPDIAIVDINMPGMNGLDALEVIRTRNKNMKIIISSAYSEFQYAKKAMLLGACDYILKPLNRDTFCETLGKVIRLLEKEWKRFDKEKKAEAQILEMNTVLGNEFLSSMMLGEPDEKSFRLLLGSMEQEYHGCIIVSARSLNQEQTLKKQYFLDLKEKIEKELSKICFCISKVHKEEICFLIFPRRNVGEQEQDRWLSDMAGMLKRLAVREGGKPFVFGVSTWQEEPENMTGGLTESRIAARSQGKSGIAFYRAREKKNKPEIRTDLAEKCTRWLKLGQAEECRRAVHTFFERSEIKEMEMESARIVVLETMFPVSETVLEERSYALRYGKGKRLDWGALMMCADKLSLEQWMLESIERLNIKASLKEKKSTEYIERTIIYMEQHYMEDISLEQTAGASGISSFYLSRLLKQELRQTFVEILTEIRMERALKMLWQGKYTVKEIAEQSGYGNITYFYKVFKKYTGMSIGEMREYME